ncbi:MAG: hypothetical protein Q9201_005311 [Fulgogasparrea decipioides]
MAGFRTKDAALPSIPAAGLVLPELLHRPPAEIQNYEQKKFLCAAEIKRLLTHETISAWITTHPSYRQSDIDAHKFKFIDCILHNSHQLFAILVAVRLEYLTFTLLSRGQTDDSLPRLNYKILGLKDDEQQKLTDKCKIFSPVLRKNTHLRLPEGTVLPFVERKPTLKYGAFGLIFHVRVAEGHLEGYDTGMVVEKFVRLNSPDDEEICSREVKTLQKREHPNIVPLFASYTLDTTESEHLVRSLHLIFPYADGGDLAEWMTRPQPPDWLQVLPREDRRAYLYSCIYALVSGLSFLHRGKDGEITAHHDLKPKNILVFGKELKIADFGRSHLHPEVQGSETQGQFGLGTYEYHPPEYWKDDGSRADIMHGRSFDIWSMGCIIVELATLIVHGWESKRVTDFRDQRQHNQHKNRPKLASQHPPDASFHNNWVIVKDWIDRLQIDDETQKLKSTLNVALQMMNQTRDSRMYAWEAELELYSIQHPDADRVTRLEKGGLCVQPPPPQARIWNGTQTPLHRASRTGDLGRICELVQVGWSMSVQDHQGLSAWDVFNQTQESWRGKILYERLVPATSKMAVDDQQGQELLQAAAYGDVSKVEGLLAQGVDAMFVDQKNRSALFMAAQSDKIRVVEHLVQAKGQELLRLKEHDWQETPLHKAAVEGHASVLEKLLICSPDIEDQRKEGRTALFVAVDWGHKEAVGVLLEHKAQVFTQANNKATPLHSAVRHHRPDILMRLLEARDAGKCLEHKNEWGYTPLWLALWLRHVDCAGILLNRGASIHVANNDDQNVLHVAVEKDLYDFLERNIHTFDLDEFGRRNRRGDTPLVIAEKQKKHNFVKLLKRHLAGT